MIDYHIHSEMSGDGQGSIIKICETAYKKGFKEICFTEHVDFEPTDLCFGHFDYDKYRSLYEAAREAYDGLLNVKFGVEIDYQEKYRSQICDFFDGKEFDYVIGAAHYVNGIILEDHDKYFPGKNMNDAYLPYLENVYATVETGLFDTIAHLDLCKRYGVLYFGPFNPLPYKNQIEVILRSVIEAGMNLEVNTSGIRQHPGETYPSQQILKWYFDMGGRNIAIGSDSHIIDNVGSGITEALRLVSKIGFDSIASYNKRIRSLLHITDLIRQNFEEEYQNSGNDNE